MYIPKLKELLYSYKILLLFLLVPLVFIFLVFIKTFSISSDGIQYATLGYSLFHNGEYASSFGVIPGWLQSPVPAILIGFFSIVFPLEFAGQTVSIISAFLIIVVLAKFTKIHLNIEIAILVIIMVAVNPLFISNTTRILAEPLYTLLHFTLFVILFDAFSNKWTLSKNQHIYVPLILGTMYLTRPEAILYLPLVLIVLFKSLRLKKIVISILIILIIFTAYGFYAKSKTENFNPFPKITYNLRMGSAISNLFPEEKINFQDIDARNTITWFAFDPNTNATFGEKIMENEYYKSLTNHNNDQKKKMLLILG